MRSPLEIPARSSASSAALLIDMLRHAERPDVDGAATAVQSRFNDLMDTAAGHDVLPYIAMRLKRSAKQDCPELLPVLDYIQVQATARNRSLREAAIRVSRLLAGQDIDAVFLKGAAFIIEDEDSAPWRVTGDLDVLVHPNAMEAAARALMAAGYQPTRDPKGYTDRLHHHFAPLIDPAEGVVVELHHRLFKDAGIDALRTEDVFAQAQLLTIGGQAMLIPSPEHRLVHQVLHAQVSNWGHVLRKIGLRDIVDLAQITSRHRIHTPTIERILGAANLSRPFSGFIAAGNEILGREVLQWPLDRLDESWAKEARSSLAAPPSQWRQSARVALHYLRLIVRNPRRLEIAWTVLRDRQRRGDLVRSNAMRVDASWHL